MTESSSTKMSVAEQLRRKYMLQQPSTHYIWPMDPRSLSKAILDERSRKATTHLSRVAKESEIQLL